MTEAVGDSYDEFPASFSQERLWFFHRFDPETAIYNTTLAVRLRGVLDVDRLRRSLSALAARHEALRTTFARVDGALVQRVDPVGDLALTRVDLTAGPAEQRFDEAVRLGTQEAERTFNLERGPVGRASVYVLGPEDHVLLCVVHHIVSDGWSMGIMLEELAELYRADVEARAPELPELKLQYADFAVWQRESLAGPALEGLLSYWRGQLDGAPAVLDLPTDRPRPPVMTHAGADVRFRVPADVAESVASAARSEGATPFMALLAGFAVLLRSYSGADDIVVGTPVAGRTQSDLEGVIGCFANTLALRVRMDDDPTFSELVARARQVVVDAVEHQEMPFERLVEELQLARHVSHTPLVQVMFALQNAPMGDVDLHGLDAEPFVLEPRTTPFDLLVELRETDDGLDGHVAYRTDLFERATIERLVDNFTAVLMEAGAEPHKRVSQLRAVTARERALLVSGWEDATAPYPRESTVHERFEAHAATNPHVLAVAGPDGEVTYGELDRRADALAATLAAAGVRRGRRVCVYAAPGVGAITAMLAVLKAGAAYVPVDADVPAARVDFIVADIDSPVVVTQSDLAAPLSGAVPVVLLDQWRPDDAPSARRRADVSGDDIAYAVYTSGSTGAPKAVLVRHRNVLNLVAWHHARFGVTADDRMGQTARLGFDASVWEIWSCLCGGASLHVADRATRVYAPALRDWMVERRLTQAQVATILAERILELEWPPGTPLRYLSCGGEKLLRRPRPDAPFEFHDMYGPAECTVISLCAHVESGSADPPGPPPLGRPVANARVHVVDPRLEPVPIGAVGEICIGGDGVAAGYLGRPELTAERFVPDPFSSLPGARLYRTGDLGRFLADGRIDMRGRVDDQVKIRGLRVEPVEIESVLATHPLVAEAVVVAAGAPRDRRLVAHVVRATGAGALDAAALRAHLRRLLPEYMVPATFVTTDELPVTASGKVDRAVLAAASADLAAGDPGGHREVVAPRTPTEHTVARLWRDTLRVADVGVTDKFFDIGGNSLALVEVYECLEQLHPGALGIADLFEHTTVEEIAAAIDARSGAPVLETAGFEL